MQRQNCVSCYYSGFIYPYLQRQNLIAAQLSWNPYEVYESQRKWQDILQGKICSANYILGAICKPANSFLKIYLEVSKHSEKLHVYR
jgi:hypothetical protein